MSDTQKPNPAIQALSIITFLLYTIIWDCGTLVGCAYLVFWREQTAWWFVLAVVMCGTSYKPSHWRRLWNEEDKK